jgi:regulatory protein
MVRFVEDGGESPDSRSSGPELAPIIPLFGGPPARAEYVPAASDDSAEDDGAEDDGAEDDGAGAAIERETAENILLKRLRTRQLSVTEARALVSQRGLGADEVDSMLEDFLRRGYLDDAGLAEQLIHVGVDRKGQGRQVIAQTLAKRGIPRDVADAALATLPDDDFERALEYARSKARSLASVDRETAVRRLAGQLARRGYRGSVALTAAQTALDESSSGLRGVAFR